MQNKNNNQIFWFGGCPVIKLNMQKLLEEIDRWIRFDSKNNYIIPVNLSKVALMQNDNKLAHCIQNSTCNISDGFSLIIAARILGENLPTRITGVELTEALFELSSKKGYKIYLLGAKPDVIEKCVAIVRLKYPGINIVGYHHGYFKSEEIDSLITEISRYSPNILFVGLGLPQKEYFITDYYRRLNTNVIIATGGTFDVIAGFKKRAPVFMQKIGAEWLWRSIYDRTRFFLISKNIWIFSRILISEFWNRRILKVAQ